MNDAIKQIEHGLIVSCQAREDEPLHGTQYMTQLAFAAKWGGAHGIRANSPKDIRGIREKVDLPIIGLYKYRYPSYQPFITPTFHEAKLIAEAGADIIAIDATQAPHPVETVQELIQRIHRELNLPVLADIATIDEAVKAMQWEADLVATTLRGYTADTKGIEMPDFEFFQRLIAEVNCPVIAEGNIREPSDARRFMDLGAFAVVVGSAISRPQEITRWFVQAVTE